MNMIISGVSSDEEGKKKAYILFEDGDKSLEATIPECSIVSNKGFSNEEVQKLIEYMQDNLAMLKREAAGINPFKAMMK